MENRSENLFWVDAVRAAVMFGVVLVHSSADVITEWGRFPAGWWWAANIYDSLARGCVPVFIMLSGALLLPKIENYRDFFLKRFQRILIPSIVWTALYLLWKKQFYVPGLGLSEALRLTAGGNVHFHLWFLYLIAGLYLITPLLRILVAHASRRDLLYLLGLWFLVSSILPFWEGWDKLFLHTGLHFKLPVELAQGFIGYFVLGHVIRRTDTAKCRNSTYGVWIVSLSVCAIGTYLLTRHFHSFQTLFYDNMAPNVVFYAASFFMIMKHAGSALETHLGAGLRRLVLDLSKASFGIYLIHPMIQDILLKGRWGFVLKGDVPHPAFMIPVTAAAIYALSFFIIFVIQKVPVLKRIV
jgi:surface polysaccharide O-acyltransferase-like enzyme